MTDQRTIVWHPSKITKEDRHRLNGHRGAVLWFTGLSGAGKSTLSVALESELYKYKVHSYVLDGDNIRLGLNNNLGFSPSERRENIRRVGEIAKLFADAGFLALSALISPYRKDRDMVRARFDSDEFIEIYVKCSLVECERRDPKGLYKRARRGEISEFTGISAPYEEPLSSELIIETDKMTVEASVKQIIDYLKKRKLI
ncbi:adenylyl-sulfate kinase [Paenibacillus alvei]|uniref:adenylyl-sulfate kinase n=1 Tax=Paenibacillus alvei TaxID=44250 RepID=UPI00038685AA|nr:adenylyl-sulfate kinase [Paenibacillus alvei]EPY14013.1 adenylylsulfate kinase [Paenibacillus alvei A6-6i-x]